MDKCSLAMIGNRLIRIGANRNLVTSILNDKRIQDCEKIMLLSDIYHKVRRGR